MLGAVLSLKTPGADVQGYSWWDNDPVKKIGDNMGLNAGDDYVATLWFMFESLTTVGFGDLRPGTTSERVFIITVMFIGASAFGYILGCVAADFGLKTDNFDSIKNYCDRKGLGRVLLGKLNMNEDFASKFKPSRNLNKKNLPVHISCIVARQTLVHRWRWYCSSSMSFFVNVIRQCCMMPSWNCCSHFFSFCTAPASQPV